MIQTMKRGLALLIVLVMCLSLVPALILNTSAAQVNYVYSSQGYIYNWGTRGTDATFLSPNAEKFYDDNNTSYDVLAAYSGGTGTSNAPNSALYRELQKLMKNNHSYITSYSANNDLLKYTDCQNSGGKISSFYSGTAIGPGWGEGGSWNKEHTWPNSKGLNGSDEDDIMMIRPTASSENSSRGNKAYGQSSGYYNPNSESGGKYDLRGDVARIFLYVYVRWGNVNGNGQYSTWGSSGVMESLDVLLAWMEADPVDTWELGRNDSVESITGTRNVFVDYPELAFLLFGAEIPENMTTPSGEAAGSTSKCDHNNFGAGVIVVATCTDEGYTIYTCQTANCGYSYKTAVVAATGHNYVSGACSACGEAEPNVPKYVTSVVPGTAYKLGLFSTEKNAEQYFSGTMTGYYGATDTNYNNGVDVFVETTNGGYYIYFMNSSNQKQYINLVVSGTYRNFTFASTASTVYTWDSAKNAMKTTLEGEVCYIGTYGSYYTMGVLQSSKLKDTDYIARFYTMDGGSQDTPDTPDTPSCTHNYNAVVIAPTCTAGGFTTYTCTLCGNSYKGNQTAAKGHSYTNGTCSVCGASQPSSTEATISFADTANRTTFTTSQQVWKQNGITVTNDKASATSNVADYSNPVRFYQGSNVTIEFPGMTKVEIDCTDLDTKYVDSWLNVTGATATKNGDIVTIVFDSPVNSLTYTGLAKQSRAYSITVYAEAQSQPQECQHTNTTLIGAVTATCTAAGHTGKTVCSNCGVTVSEGSTISATGHSYTNGTCTKCGSAEPTCKHANTSIEEAIAETCTTDGHSGKTVCKDCGVIVNAGSIIPATGHNYVNGTCSNCGVAQPVCQHTNTVVNNKVTVTCTTDGHTGTTVCQDCGVTVDEGEVIVATGHTFAEWRTIRTPSCIIAGLERRDCDNCSHYETNNIAALGHNDTNEDSLCDACGKQLENVTTPEETTPEAPEETTPDTPEETTPEAPEETTPEAPEETTPEVPEEDKTPDDDNAIENQEHVCEEATGWAKFWNNIMNFFRRLFGQPELCTCGEVINKED